MSRNFASHVVLGLSLAMMGIGSCAHASDPPPQTQPAARSARQIIHDLNASDPVLDQITHSVLLDDAQRKQLAVRAVPALKHRVALFDELLASDDTDAKDQALSLKTETLGMLTLLGDADAKTQLERQAAGNARQAVAARAALLSSSWILAHEDGAAQRKLLDQASALARDNPTSDEVSQTLAAMSQTGSANEEYSQKLETLVAGMHNDTAEQLRHMFEIRHQLRGLENKPLVVHGAKLGGGEFSTEQWKGKVVLVDFWATWCLPCREAIPAVVKAYSTWHDKGLEILGVSSDEDAPTLSKFLQANPQMSWPQLFDPAAGGDINPVANSLGVKSFPTMFLIDRNGIVRSTSAEENFEQLIPKLIAEK